MTKLCNTFSKLLTAIGFDEVGFVKPVATEDAILLINFNGQKYHLLAALKNILNQVENQFKEERIDEIMLLEIVPIDQLVQEPMYSSIVDHNISGMKERSIALLKKCDYLKSNKISGMLKK